MNTVRNDFFHDARSPSRHFKEFWKHQSIRDLEQASLAADSILLALKQAGYEKRDMDGMRIALDEVIVNALLGNGWPLPDDVHLDLRYQVNESYAAVEVETHGAAGRPQNAACKSSSRTTASQISAPPSIYSYMTWIRYSKKDHSATLCRCSLLK